MKYSTSNHSKQGRRACAFLAVIWSISVLTLTRFCVVELRVLRLQKEAFLRARAVGLGDNGFVVLNSTSSGDRNNSNVSSLLAVISKTTISDATQQISRAVATALTDETPTIPAESSDGDTATPEKSSNKKGHLILHVGPSKTATTSLQTDLTVAHDQGWFDRDEYFYAGRYYRPYTSPTTGVLLLNRTESKLLEAARSMLNRCPEPVKTDCCVHFKQELETLYQEKLEEHKAKTTTISSGEGENDSFHLNIILSDEAFGNMWLDASDYQAIAATVNLDEWDVTVVAGYRRFYEWLLSSKYQRDRIDRISAYGKELWPSLDPNVRGGRALLPIFPDTYADWTHWFHFTDSVLNNVNGTFPVKILNLHSTSTTASTGTKKSVLTQFLCDMLEGATDACRRSEERDAVEEITILNAQTQAVIPSLFYDALATAAAEAGMFNTNAHKRCDVREAIRAYHEDILELTPDDLILKCPDESELEELYQLSVDMERTFMPELVLDEGDETHRNGFLDKVAKKAYCWVDSSAVLQQSHWKQFFEQFEDSGPLAEEEVPAVSDLDALDDQVSY